MSRIDYITLAIVLFCLVALVYVLVRVANLNTSAQPAPSDSPPEYSGADTVSSAPPDTATTAIKRDSASRQEQAEAAAANTASELGSPGAASSSTTGPYLVVAASFPTQAEAEAELARFQAWGYAEAEIGFFNGGEIAAVIVGRFPNNAQARERVQALRRDRGIEAYVHLKRE